MMMITVMVTVMMPLSVTMTTMMRRYDYVVPPPPQLKRGDIKFVSALGLQLAVFRGKESGKVTLDADNNRS